MRHAVQDTIHFNLLPNHFRLFLNLLVKQRGFFIRSLLESCQFLRSDLLLFLARLSLACMGTSLFCQLMSVLADLSCLFLCDLPFGLCVLLSLLLELLYLNTSAAVNSSRHRQSSRTVVNNSSHQTPLWSSTAFVNSSSQQQSTQTVVNNSCQQQSPAVVIKHSCQ